MYPEVNAEHIVWLGSGSVFKNVKDRTGVARVRQIGLGLIGAAGLCVAAPGVASAGVIFTNAKADYVTGYGTVHNVVETSQDVDIAPGIVSPSSTASSGGSEGIVSAYANLATGKVGMRSDTAGATGSASAGFGDQIQFNIAGASADTVTVIGVNLHFDGEIFNTGTAGYTFLFEDNAARINYSNNPYYGSVNFYAAKIAQNTGGMSVAAYGAWIDPPAHTVVSFPGTEGFGVGFSPSFDHTYYFGLRGANPVMNISLLGNVSSGYDSTANFNNTGAFTFTLPETVTFTSSSGQLLTAPSGAVPEPASWAMMIIGFAGAGAGVRRRKALAA